jgi:hypothetical protein
MTADVRRAGLYALAMALICVAVDTRAQCPLARWCCDDGQAMCPIEPTTPGLVCVCQGPWRQGVSC